MILGELGLRKSAVISDCGLCRYELRREWDDKLPPLVVGMLNPSKADAEISDPTVTRCWKRAETLGFGSLIVWNAGAGRATDPNDWKRMDDPIGPENDYYIMRLLNECMDRDGKAIVGWGVHGTFMNRHLIIGDIAKAIGISLYCLGATKEGHPRHPLYVPYDQPSVEWAAR